MIKLAKILQINQANIALKLEQNNKCSDCKNHCSDGFFGFLFNKYNHGKLTVARDVKQLDCHLIDETGFFDQGSQVNDVIGIDFDENKLLKLTLLLYGLPIILIIFALIVGYFIFNAIGFNKDIGGIIGFILGLWLAKYLITKNQTKIKPQVKFFK